MSGIGATGSSTSRVEQRSNQKSAAVDRRADDNKERELREQEEKAQEIKDQLDKDEAQLSEQSQKLKESEEKPPEERKSFLGGVLDGLGKVGSDICDIAGDAVEVFGGGAANVVEFFGLEEQADAIREQSEQINEDWDKAGESYEASMSDKGDRADGYAEESIQGWNELQAVGRGEKEMTPEEQTKLVENMEDGYVLDVVKGMDDDQIQEMIPNLSPEALGAMREVLPEEQSIRLFDKYSKENCFR